MKIRIVLVLALVAGTPGCLVMQRDVDAMAAKQAQTDTDLRATRAELGQTRADLEATRQRLDNALRASADSSTEQLSSKQKVADLSGRFEEVQHSLDDLKRDIAQSRSEIYVRIDDLKRAQQASVPGAPAPVAVPADKVAHAQKLEEAYTKKDWPTVRTLGNEYVNRYSTDDRADTALFYVGDADLQDGRPSSALASFNRLLKLYPHSKALDRTLYDMGEAYLAMHDCTDAKTAFDACHKRFGGQKAGVESKAKLDTIAKNPPGLCAPQ